MKRLGQCKADENPRVPVTPNGGDSCPNFYKINVMDNTKENIETIFANLILDAKLTTGTRDFINSLKKYFKKHYKLSANQFTCLLEIFNAQKQRKKK